MPVDERQNFFGRRRFELARDVQCIVDFDGRFKDVSPALQTALGYEREEICGRVVSDFVHPEDWQRTVEHARELQQGGVERAWFENRYRNKDGDWVWLEWAAQVAQVEGLIYISGRNISARKRRELELERAALIDPLTGLENRRGFERSLERELAAASRHALRPGLVVIDLDRFKSINDTHGHLVGDRLLVAAADTLLETVRASDIAARIGGDEFAVLLPNCHIETAKRVAEKVAAALADKTVQVAERRVPISASTGVAVLGQDGIATGAELITAADQAMYRAKRRRRSPALRDG